MRLGWAKRPPLLTTAPRVGVGDARIFDSVRRKFVRASVGWSESNLADVSQKALSHKRFTSRDTVVRKRHKARWSASADKAKQLDLTEEFDPGSE